MTNLVKEFHQAFGHPIAESPTIPSADFRLLRVKLLLEEVLEFAEASGIRLWANEEYCLQLADINFYHTAIPNPVEAADALADIRYVTDGANLVWGFPQEAILAEVHRSNMSKLGSDGKPLYRADGKILKGPNYSPPDIASILKQYTP